MLVDDMDFVRKLQEPSYTDVPGKPHSPPQKVKRAQDTQLRKANDLHATGYSHQHSFKRGNRTRRWRKINLRRRIETSNSISRKAMDRRVRSCWLPYLSSNCHLHPSVGGSTRGHKDSLAIRSSNDQPIKVRKKGTKKSVVTDQC
jgi:hypothetical protein